MTRNSTGPASQRIMGLSDAPRTDSGGMPGTAPGAAIGMRGVRAKHGQLHGLMMSVAEFFWSGRLSPRDRELITIRVGVLAQSEYELLHHHRIGLASGLRQEEIDQLAQPSLGWWDERDRAILRAVDELFKSVDIGDDTWERLAGVFGEPELIEFLYLVGWYWTTCAFVNAVRVQVDQGTGA